ncbi:MULTISPECIES: sensor histidine kinase [Streptomyces]|uniref:Histidine kinase n=1 Tax=Streptomyces sudanensis TaxID=436397 RepID=A0ABY4TCV1_9ACTN|nr:MULTISPECIES: histidine kinase [Streptomyces]URN16774.1 histidine kinase [Streptomyces sudanensis]
MAGLTGWWTRRSNPEKVELYTRWTYHGLAGVNVLIGGLPALAAVNEVGPLGGWLFLAVLLHAVLVAVLSSQALGWQLGRRGRPKRLAAAVAALTAGGCAAVLVLRRMWPEIDLQTSMYIVVGLAGWGVGALALCTVRVRHILGLAVGTVAGLAAAAAVVGLPPADTVAYTFSAAFGAALFAFTSGFSGWLLRAVWELDAAHRLQARLAIAEERLRFARDLHDVMGRNLSVIALKSELAVRLARHGAADRAVGEMDEVQRIARESQREVREVVRGYREADLHTELEGARGVLAAAGIRCRVDVRDPDTDLPAAAQSALAWVVREAATNVLRHSDARHCRVTVSAPPDGGQAVLVVENDGVGAGPPRGGAPGGVEAPGAVPGSGLAGLRERLAVLGGVLEAGPADGGGRFRVTARVPLEEGDRGPAAGEPAGRAQS